LIDFLKFGRKAGVYLKFICIFIGRWVSMLERCDNFDFFIYEVWVLFRVHIIVYNFKFFRWDILIFHPLMRGWIIVKYFSNFLVKTPITIIIGSVRFKNSAYTLFSALIKLSFINKIKIFVWNTFIIVTKLFSIVFISLESFWHKRYYFIK
jgi:hypothetical protein